MMNIHSKPGTKVKFIDKNGTKQDKKYASKILNIEDVYTVKSIEVHRWVSYVTLEEVPNHEFNTVMFEDYNGQ